MSPKGLAVLKPAHIPEISRALEMISQPFMDGFGSENLRAAACHFVYYLSTSEFISLCTYQADTVHNWCQVMESTLDRPEEHLQIQSASALRKLFLVEFPFNFQSKLKEYVEKTTPANSKATRRGFTLALGSFPRSVLSQNMSIIFPALHAAATLEVLF